MKNLKLVKDKLEKLDIEKRNYFIPSLWMGNLRPGEDEFNIDPSGFFVERINKIISMGEQSKTNIPEKEWLGKAIVYNVFVRYLTAYDHDKDGKINIEYENFRETGTFLKLIALLPYLRSLGINTLHLLPITSIGVDGKKGDLGSPYAIRNHYALDDNLGEKIIGLSTETQFKAFVEASHHLGMKVIIEFVFRTASIDSDLSLEHPEWFYWIKENIKDRPPDSDSEYKYGNPIFTEEELKEIKNKVESGDLINLPEPHDVYKDMFMSVPKKIARVGEKIIGVYDNDRTARIPGAFADWPPDDTQPPWDDVTYLRLFNSKRFNYIAYNTVRMYDEALAKNRYRMEELWNYISDIIPFYIDQYDIDGVMVDMGHALPAPLMDSIIRKARRKKKGFVFWEENFSLNIDSVFQGYDACIGYMPFDQHEPWKMKQILRMLERAENPISFFATPESHNTPRAVSRPGSVDYCKQTWLINRFMNQIPFMLGGFELASAQPVNTGLGFRKDELNMFPAEKLPLFSASALPWQTKAEFTEFIIKVNKIRDNYEFENIDKKPLIHIETSEDPIIAFIRKVKDQQKYIIILCNMQNEIRNNITIEIPVAINKAIDILSHKPIVVINGKIQVELFPWESICAELS